MKFISVIIASFFGTAIMTLVLYLFSIVSTRAFRVPKVLGTMITMETGPEGELSPSSRSTILGTLAHYAVGAAFGVMFLMLWDADVGEINMPWAIFFGIGAGVIGILLWHLFLMVHPRPPLLPMRSYYATLLVGHIIFGIVTFYMYNYLTTYVFDI